MPNTLVRNLAGMEGNEEVTLAAAAVPGDIVFTGDGKAAVVLGTRDYASGETVAVSTNAIVDVDCGSATTFAIKATVYWNTSTKLAVAAGATQPHLGAAVRAKLNGETKARVRLNAVAVAAA